MFYKLIKHKTQAIMVVMMTADRLRIFRIMDINIEAMKWKGKSESANKEYFMRTNIRV
jgi:hypothetical protein